MGIHNVLEAAVWGMPVIFGPNNKNFIEAQGLIAKGGGFEIASYDDFETVMTRLTNNDDVLKKAGDKAGRFVKSCTGATAKILSEVYVHAAQKGMTTP